MHLKVDGRILSKNVPIANNWFRYILGLMGFQKGELLMDFKKEIPIEIHTFFCRPMNLIFINSKGEVVEFIKAKPWKVFPYVKARYVFETTNLKKIVKKGQKITLD